MSTLEHGSIGEGVIVGGVLFTVDKYHLIRRFTDYQFCFGLQEPVIGRYEVRQAKLSLLGLV